MTVQRSYSRALEQGPLLPGAARGKLLPRRRGSPFSFFRFIPVYLVLSQAPLTTQQPGSYFAPPSLPFWQPKQ